MSYTDIKQCSNLAATAVALKIDGVTNTSTDAQKLAAVNKLMIQGQTLSSSATNTFIENITEKVLVQKVILSSLWKTPFISLFINQGSSPSKIGEIIEGKPIAPGDYNPNARILDKDNIVKNVVQRITDRIWKTSTITIYQTQAAMRSAFISERSWSQWLSSQVKEMRQGLELYMHDLFVKYIKDNVKNKISYKGKTLENSFIELIKMTKDMGSELTYEYALGFTKADIIANKYVMLSPTTGKWVVTTDTTNTKIQDIIKKEVLDYKDMVLITSVSFLTDLKSKLGANKFHNEFFKTETFGKVIALKDERLFDNANKQQSMYLIDKNAFFGWLILETSGSQYWPLSLKSDIIKHWTGAYGLIRWKMGVEIILDNTFTSASILKASQELPQ